MSLIILKLIFALAIFTTTIIFAILPLKIANSKKALLEIGDAFASGVFLSAALIHMLPDASHAFTATLGSNSYPFAELICTITFILLLFLERGTFSFCQKNSRYVVTPYLLVMVISIHSIIAGTALGISMSIAGAMIIFLAIIAHKGSESFALTSNLYRYKLPVKRIIKIIALFSLATPLGIIIASSAELLLHTNSGTLSAAIFNACAAGTFLYLGTVHSIAEPKIKEICALIFGIALMAIVAIWL